MGGKGCGVKVFVAIGGDCRFAVSTILNAARHRFSPNFQDLGLSNKFWYIPTLVMEGKDRCYKTCVSEQES